NERPPSRSLKPDIPSLKSASVALGVWTTRRSSGLRRGSARAKGLQPWTARRQRIGWLGWRPRRPHRRVPERTDTSSAPLEGPDVYIVERLFSSSLVVVVSLSMPRRMNVYHFKKGTEICNYSYSNNILSVKLNRQSTVTLIQAHDSPLAALTFNASGSKLASASEKVRT
ncbi:hypothetical protein GOODEAATRI_007652, partial [Goodea atripinnis]